MYFFTHGIAFLVTETKENYRGFFNNTYQHINKVIFYYKE